MAVGAFRLKTQLKQPFSLVRLYLKLAVVTRIRSPRTEKLRQENRLVDGYPELWKETTKPYPFPTARIQYLLKERLVPIPAAS